MALLDQFALANDPIFKERVRTATIIAAGENAAALDLEPHVYQYANEIIKNPNGGWVDGMAFQVAANPAIDEDATDSDIQFTVNSNFEKCARAFMGVIPIEEEPEPVP